MKMRTFFFLMSLMLVSPLMAKSPAKADSQSEVIRLVVNYGDQVSRFEISNEGKTGRVSLQQNRQPLQSKSLQEDEINHLKERIGKLPQLTNDISLCPRSYIQLTAKNHNKKGCIGGQNAIAKELQEFANLLSAKF